MGLFMPDSLFLRRVGASEFSLWAGLRPSQNLFIGALRSFKIRLSTRLALSSQTGAVSAVSRVRAGAYHRHALARTHARSPTFSHAGIVGLQKMREKYLLSRFGVCPRVLCERQNVLPVGMSEELRTSRVKVFCPRCEDVYIPKKKCPDVDGAYFGCSFPQIMLMVDDLFFLCRVLSTPLEADALCYPAPAALPQ